MKILRGSRQRRPRTEDEPVLTAGTPRKPQGLTRIESVYWTRLVKSLAARRTLDKSQGDILQLACSYYWQFQKCREACKESAVYVTTSREGAVIWKAKPEAALMNQAKKGLLHCLEHLGLTPASAARVHALPAAKKNARGGIESYFDNPSKPSA